MTIRRGWTARLLRILPYFASLAGTALTEPLPHNQSRVPLSDTLEVDAAGVWPRRR
ncbi:hypothetical protein ACFVUS_00660 [Nocardia sp. NPDC058058]|uniref:hypothetical protein n=1 Tax=Nocardia sp. NPDC058058 TaxID=3346317 RepID=UPI0036D936FF